MMAGRMQEVEIALNERGRSQFEDLFPHDNRTIVKVVTLMAMLELCKLDFSEARLVTGSRQLDQHCPRVWQ